jgi:hypothetical protein
VSAFELAEMPELEEGTELAKTPKLDEVDELVEMPELNKGGMLDETPELDKGSKLAQTPELDKGGELAETSKLLWVFAFGAVVWVVPLPWQLLAMTFGIIAPINLGGSWMTDILLGVIALGNTNTNATEVPVVVLVLPEEVAPSPPTNWH